MENGDRTGHAGSRLQTALDWARQRPATMGITIALVAISGIAAVRASLDANSANASEDAVSSAPKEWVSIKPLKDSWNPSISEPIMDRRASLSCQEYVREKFSGQSTSNYEHVMNTEVSFGHINNYYRVSNLFEHHPYVAFQAVVYRYIDGHLRGTDAIPYKFCILDSQLKVLTLETNERE